MSFHAHAGVPILDAPHMDTRCVQLLNDQREAMICAGYPSTAFIVFERRLNRLQLPDRTVVLSSVDMTRPESAMETLDVYLN